MANPSFPSARDPSIDGHNMMPVLRQHLTSAVLWLRYHRSSETWVG